MPPTSSQVKPVSSDEDQPPERVFVGERGHTMKVLTRDGTGVILVHQKLDAGPFELPRATSLRRTLTAQRSLGASWRLGCRHCKPRSLGSRERAPPGAVERGRAGPLAHENALRWRASQLACRWRLLTTTRCQSRLPRAASSGTLRTKLAKAHARSFVTRGLFKSRLRTRLRPPPCRLSPRTSADKHNLRAGATRGAR